MIVIRCVKKEDELGLLSAIRGRLYQRGGSSIEENYVFGKWIGKGSFGEVRSAVRLKDSKEVAVKIVQKQAKMMARIRSEI